MRKLIFAAVAALCLGGCATSLSTLPDREQTQVGDAMMGTPYALPMLQYDVTLTRTLSSCPDDRDWSFGGRDFVLRAGSLAIATKADAKASYGPGERYTVDYRALEAPFKTSSFSFVTNPNKTLKSIGASAEDQTGDVIKSVVSTALTVASLASGNPAALGPVVPALVPPAPPPPNAAAPQFSARAARAEAARQAYLSRYNAALIELANSARTTPIVACTKDAADLTVKASQNAGAQDTASKTLKGLNADVNRLTLIANLKTAGAKDAPAAKARGAVGARDWASELNAAIAAQDKASAGLQDLVEDGKTLSGKLSADMAFTWPVSFHERDPRDFPADEPTTKKLRRLLQTETTVALITPTAFKAWFDRQPADLQADFRKIHAFGGMFDDKGAVVDEPPGDANCQGPAATLAACWTTQTAVFAQFTAAGVGLYPCGDTHEDKGDCLKAVQAINELDDRNRSPRALGERVADAAYLPGRHARDTTPDKGVFVRDPAIAVFWLCGGAPQYPLKQPACTGKAKLYASDPIPAPQFGQLRFLPFRNGPFQSNSLSLALRDDGSIEKFEYQRTKAAGVQAAAAVQDAVSQYKTFRDDQDKKRQDDLTAGRAEQIAKIQFQIDTLTKQKELLKLQTPDSVDADKAIKDETAHIDAQTELLKAQLAQLQAQAALTAAGGGGG
jgi:hypothetical protein